MSIDRVFAGSIPALYERLLVPLIFAPYAQDLARRVRDFAPARVLELAAGTGVATRAMAAQLPASAEIVATDLNPAMLEEAQRHPIARAVSWRVADATMLPFEDASFDCVACQFGVMFFPDRVRGFAEARRVLRAGGRFLFNTWDAIADNEFAEEVTEALARWRPEASLRFLSRTPHGYHEPARVRADLAAGGFTQVEVEKVAARSRAASARDPAIAYCQGTPLRNELEALGTGVVEAATEVAAAALARRFGDGPVEGRIQALVASATKEWA
jgi:ubiquinone/menaquinone biosynthesis C-methylase UbiE